jgi:hypothetical protein
MRRNGELILYRVFAKLPTNDLKLNYGDGTGLNVHFKGFEE